MVVVIFVPLARHLSVSPLTLLPVLPLPSLPHLHPRSTRPARAHGIERRRRGRNVLAVGLEFGPLDLVPPVFDLGESALSTAPDDEEDRGKNDDTLRDAR